MLVADLDGAADWDLTNLMGGTDLGIGASIRWENGRLLEACTVFGKSVPSSDLDFLSLPIHGVEEMSRAFILCVRAGPLKLTLSSNSTRIG